MCIFIVFILFKAVVFSCPCFVFISDNAIKDAVYILFREVVIVLICILILEGAYYYEIMTYTYYYDSSNNLIIVGANNDVLPSFNISGTTYCSLLALFIWTMLGFILCVMAQR
jgi:hypothetical protein